MKNNLLMSFLLPWIIVGCSSQKDITISHTEPAIRYEGRVFNDTKMGAELYWPGTSVEVNFKGTDIFAEIHDEKGENFYNVIIDGKVASVLNPTAEKRTYALASGLSLGKHRVTLYKRTEFSNGKTTFFNFLVKNKAKVLEKSPKKKRKIEFYGDSISAGYAIDDTTGTDNGEAPFTNNYLTYGAITARYFDAEFNCICKSGIGLMISWFPYTMPDIYARLNPLDKNSTWNFVNHTPDIVVVNLFQNDSWLINNPTHQEFKATFGSSPPSKEMIVNTYKSFISILRKHYPNADIICALGNMNATKKDSQWPEYITEAKTQMNDSKVHTVFFPFKETKGHPSIAEQQMMADQLILYIEKNMKW